MKEFNKKKIKIPGGAVNSSLSPSVHPDSIQAVESINISEQFISNSSMKDRMVSRIQEEMAGLTTKEQESLFEEDREIFSIFERVTTLRKNNNGTLETPFWKENGKPKYFNSTEAHEKWAKTKVALLKAQIESRKDPSQFYLTFNKTMERPYTGSLWDNETPGTYCCSVCSQNLFSSTHKFKSNCGHASFWSHLPHTVRTKKDTLDYKTPTQAVLSIEYSESKPVERVECSNCETHLGFLFEDGPAPYYKRIIVNSPLLKFKPLGNLKNPDDLKKERMAKNLKKRAEKVRKSNEVLAQKMETFPEMFELLDSTVEKEKLTFIEENEELVYN